MFRMFCHFFFQCVDFLMGKEGEILQILHHIPVILVEPELIEFIGGRLLRIQPYRAAGGFAKLGAVCLQHEGDGEAEGIMHIFRLSEKFYAVCNVAPLVSAADLELHIVLVIEHFEINGLENLVGEFGEGNPCFQTGSHHFLGQHGIDIEQLAIVTKEFQKGNFGKPVIVVHHGEAIFAEKFLHLGCEAFRIMLDGLLGLKHPFCLPARRITDGTGTAADNNDRMMTGQLETLQNHEWNQMTDMHAVAGGINAAVKGNGFFPYQLVQSFLIGLLIDSATPFQFINNIHRTPPFFIQYLSD